jgi:desampylase
VFSEELDRELVRLAEIAAPEEACGLVVLLDGHIHLQPITNVASDPHRRFDMDELELRIAFARYDVLGTYHSHPTGPARPSTTDMHYADPFLRHWLVVEGKVLEWSQDGVVGT